MCETWETFSNSRLFGYFLVNPWSIHAAPLIETMTCVDKYCMLSGQHFARYVKSAIIDNLINRRHTSLQKGPGLNMLTF